MSGLKLRKMVWTYTERPSELVVRTPNEPNAAVPIEPFDTIVSKLEKKAGFFSMLFFLVNHYNYCKKTHTNFKLETSNWLYKYNIGWLDYFEGIELIYNQGKKNHYVTHEDVLEDYPILDYKTQINDIYKYNQKTKDAIQSVKSNLQMTEKYDSIYIRRGDKLAIESKIIPEENYVDLLLKLNPLCNYIFLQTDDYNCYLTIQKYITSKNLDIRLETLCNKEMVGTITHNRYKNDLKHASIHNEHNKEYITSIQDKLNNTKSIEDMTPDELYQQAMELIVSIDIVVHSNICITDYQSNVARFIKLKHVTPENVYDVTNPEQDIDYTKSICPAFSF